MFDRRRMSLLMGALLALFATSDMPRAGAEATDPNAVAIADKVMTSLGGQKAWERTRFLRFDFAVEKD